jgi:hypothetical protein
MLFFTIVSVVCPNDNSKSDSNNEAREDALWGGRLSRNNEKIASAGVVKYRLYSGFSMEFL